MYRSSTATPAPAVDTRSHIPVTYPVLDRGSRSPQRHHGANPWNQILEPRGSGSKKKTKVSKAQSPTTSAAARRVRRKKAAERERLEEEDAQKKGGVAYTRMKREKAMKAEKDKREKEKGHAKNYKRTGSTSKSSTTTTTTSTTSTATTSSRNSNSNSNSNSNNTCTKKSSKATAIIRGSRTAARRTGNAQKRHSGKSGKGSIIASRPTKIPTPKKMRQLKQDADTQESIRALIDKVTIEFERLPSSVPTEDRDEVDRGVRTMLQGVSAVVDGGGGGAAASTNSTNTTNTTSTSSVRETSLLTKSTRPRSVNESVDLESARVDIEINHQEVDREEVELQRRAHALEADMKRLKERKLKLHLAKYEHELRSASKEQLAAIVGVSHKDMSFKITTLKDRTKKQLDSIVEFEKDLKMKIQRLMKVRFLVFVFDPFVSCSMFLYLYLFLFFFNNHF